MLPNDTIVAISSAVGPAARMIVRISGGDARTIAGRLCEAALEPGKAIQATLHVNDMPIPAWVYCFVAPRSYTGEDLIEFHLPGNPLLARSMLNSIVTAGARLAEPGEFTARAYFSGRIDLTEAEGVAVVIGAHCEQELRAARQLLAGELSRRLKPAMDRLAETLALVEAGIDFSDEGISFLPADAIERRLAELDGMLDELVRSSARFERLAHEPTFVLIGRANAGKSTLLNALAGHDRAVVSPIAGTTRDALSAEVRLRRGIVRVIDVAGIEPTDVSASDAHADIQRQMDERARQMVQTADHVLLVRDGTDSADTISLDREPDLIILTKADITPQPGAISALSGLGMDDLKERLDQIAFGRETESGTLALNARHLAAIASAREALARTRSLAQSGAGELIALELRDALDYLGQVLGQVTPDDVLGRVFSAFCIGK